TCKLVLGSSRASGRSVSSVNGSNGASRGANPGLSTRTLHIPASGAVSQKVPAASVETLAAASGPALPASSSLAISRLGSSGMRETRTPGAAFPSEVKTRPVTGIPAAWREAARSRSSGKASADNLFTMALLGSELAGIGYQEGAAASLLYTEGRG